MPFLPRSSCCPEEPGWPGARRRGGTKVLTLPAVPTWIAGANDLAPSPQALGRGVNSWIRSPGTTGEVSHPVTILLQSAVPRGTVGWGAAFPLARSGFSEWAWAKGISACTANACSREAWRVACVDSSVCVQLCSCVGFDCRVACLATYMFLVHVRHMCGRSLLGVACGYM